MPWSAWCATWRRRMAAVSSERRATFIAPNAALCGEVALACGTTVWFGASLYGDAAPVHIGTGSNVQDGATLASAPQAPLRLGRGVTVGHQVSLTACDIGDHSLIGIQAVVARGARIGRWCLVGAGSHVPAAANIADGTLALGNPARAVRKLRLGERLLILLTGWHYRYNGWRYTRRLRIVDAAHPSP